MAQDDRRQRGLTLEELCTAPVFCWEQRTGRCFCGSAEFRILPGVQLNGLNLPFPGITPVGVSELHQGQVTPGCLPVVLHPSAGWEGDAAVGSLLLRLRCLSGTGLEGWRGQSLIALLQFVSRSCYSYRL